MPPAPPPRTTSIQLNLSALSSGANSNNNAACSDTTAKANGSRKSAYSLSEQIRSFTINDSIDEDCDKYSTSTYNSHKKLSVSRSSGFNGTCNWLDSCNNESGIDNGSTASNSGLNGAIDGNGNASTSFASSSRDTLANSKVKNDGNSDSGTSLGTSSTVKNIKNVLRWTRDNKNRKVRPKSDIFVSTGSGAASIAPASAVNGITAHGKKLSRSTSRYSTYEVGSYSIH